MGYPGYTVVMSRPRESDVQQQQRRRQQYSVERENHMGKGQFHGIFFEHLGQILIPRDNF